MKFFFKKAIFKAMNARTHDGQMQVVEGSAVGHFFVTPKMEYGPCGSLIFLGESKTSTADNENKFFIQKMIYDNNFNLVSIKIAQNLTTTGSTSLNLTILNQKVVEIALNDGDFTETNINDGINLKTPTQELSGRIFKKISDTVIHVEVTSDTSSLVNETSVTISETDLIVRLEHDKTKFYTNRRWDHRNRYQYS